MAARPQITDLTIRRMLAEDLSEVMQIENQVYRFPWTQRIFSDCLRVGYYCQVCENEHGLAGYVIASSGAGEAHILNLCVDPRQQGKGIGRLLLQSILDKLRAAGMESVFLEVRPSNLSAIQLYHNLGFNEIGRRQNYYPAVEGREDALVFALTFLPD